MSTRISKIPSEFVTDLNNQNIYLDQDSPTVPGFVLAPSLPPPPPGGIPPSPAVAAVPAFKNWQRLWLTPEERQRFRTFTETCSDTYLKFSNEDVRSHATVEKMFLQMDDFSKFFSPILDRISGNPYVNIDDLVEFNIHSNVIRDSRPTRHSAELVEIISPVVAVTGTQHLVHELGITFTHHKGKGKPKGVKEVLVYFAKTATPNDVPSQAGYNYIGDAHNGKFIHMYDESLIGLTGWYIARVKDSHGNFGPFSVAVHAQMT